MMMDNMFLVEVPAEDRVILIMKYGKNKPENIYVVKENQPFVIFATSNSLADDAGEIYLHRWPDGNRQEWIREAVKCVLDRLRNYYKVSLLCGDDSELLRSLLNCHLYDALKKTKDGEMSLAHYRRNYYKFENKEDWELEKEGEFCREDAVYGFSTLGQIRIYNEIKVENTKMYDFWVAGMIWKGEKGLEVITTREGDLLAYQSLLYHLVAAAQEQGMELAKMGEEWIDFIINPSKF